MQTEIDILQLNTNLRVICFFSQTTVVVVVVVIVIVIVIAIAIVLVLVLVFVINDNYYFAVITLYMY